MSQIKKVLLTLSDDEKKLLTHEACMKDKSIDELVSELVKKHLETDRAGKLKKGYQEMAQINLELAQMCFEADDEGCQLYEEKLTECE